MRHERFTDLVVAAALTFDTSAFAGTPKLVTESLFVPARDARRSALNRDSRSASARLYENSAASMLTPSPNHRLIEDGLNVHGVGRPGAEPR